MKLNIDSPYLPSLRLMMAVIMICAVVLTPQLLNAQNNSQPIVIRDTEIESYLAEWMAPLLEAAGLGPDSVNLVLVQSPQINAFVSGGANMFLYTGLIESTEDPGELIGVMAHELGHIAGGHLIGMRDAMERASYESILGAFIGAAAAIATGEGGAAAAVISGTSNMAQRRFLAHTRINESSADQAALRIMEKAAVNPDGLRSFLNKLEDEELLPPDQQTEYIRTHPLTHNRIEALNTNIEQSAYNNQPYPAAWKEQHARIKAKLMGFINPGRVIWHYDDRDRSVAARYAKSVAAYRENKTGEALELIDGLIAEEPENPYFYELKGQMLVDFGRVNEALPYYKQAIDKAPDAGLIRIALAHALIESGGGQPNLQEAASHLKRALVTEPRSTRAHRLLATSYGRQGMDSRAKLHLAEEALLQRRLPYAKAQANMALQGLENGSREWLRAKDILAHIENLERMEQ